MRYGTHSLILLALFTLVTGCSTTKISPAGDATVRVTKRFTGFDLLVGPKRIYEIELPRVSLSDVGEHRFHVRGLPVLVTPNKLFLVYPLIGPLSVESYREKWKDARLRVQFVQTSGQVLFDHTVEFATAHFTSGHARYTRPNFTYDLENQSAEARLSEHVRCFKNYDVRITVEKPARENGHFFRLRGQALDFLGRGALAMP